MFCFHCFTADLTPWSRFSRKNIIYKFNFELFLFCFFPLNWSKANTINVIKPEKSGKEVIGLKITHKRGLHWWNHFLKQFRKCLYRHLAVKEKFLCQVHEFEVKTYWRSLGWTWPELKSHKSDSMAFAVTYSHFFKMLVTWAWKRNKFIRIGWCVVCTYQLLYDNVNYTCIFIGCQPRATIPSSVWLVINYKIINFLNGQLKNQTLLVVGYKIPRSLTSNMKENAVTVTLSFAFSIIEDFVEESNENPSLIYTVYS